MDNKILLLDYKDNKYQNKGIYTLMREFASIVNFEFELVHNLTVQKLQNAKILAGIDKSLCYLTYKNVKQINPDLFLMNFNDPFEGQKDEERCGYENFDLLLSIDGQLFEKEIEVGYKTIHINYPLTSILRSNIFKTRQAVLEGKIDFPFDLGDKVAFVNFSNFEASKPYRFIDIREYVNCLISAVPNDYKIYVHLNKNLDDDTYLNLLSEFYLNLKKEYSLYVYQEEDKRLVMTSENKTIKNFDNPMDLVLANSNLILSSADNVNLLANATLTEVPVIAFKLNQGINKENENLLNLLVKKNNVGFLDITNMEVFAKSLFFTPPAKIYKNNAITANIMTLFYNDYIKNGNKTIISQEPEVKSMNTELSLRASEEDNINQNAE